MHPRKSIMVLSTRKLPWMGPVLRGSFFAGGHEEFGQAGGAATDWAVCPRPADAQAVAGSMAGDALPQTVRPLRMTHPLRGVPRVASAHRYWSLSTMRGSSR